MKSIVKNIHGKEWFLFVFVVLADAGQVYFDVTIPDFMAKLTNLLQLNQTGVSDVIAQGAMMMLFAVLSLTIGIICAYCAAKLGGLIALRLRSSVFDHVLDFSLDDVEKFGSASLITRITNDIKRIQDSFVVVFITLFKAPLSAAWAFKKISGKNGYWTLTMGLIMLVIMIVSIVVLAKVLPLVTKQQYETDELTKIDNEHITGIPVIRAFNAMTLHSKRFGLINDQLNRTMRKSNYEFTFLSAFSNSMMNFFNISVYIVGAYVISRSSTAAKMGLFSSLITFSSYALIVMAAFISLIQMYLSLAKAFAGLKRVNAVLDTDISIKDGEGEVEPTENAPVLSFRNVCFAYPGSPKNVLNTISFDVARGETVALIGATGSGKTTLLNLIPRLYDVTSGSIKVKGVDIKKYRLFDLRSMIGYVPQKSLLFSGDIAGNIGYGDNGASDYTITEIMHAATVGMASGFIENKDEGYRSRVSEGGKNFSGGQKQRISISRAICRKPGLYVFDDSFSALDFQTDKLLRDKLKEEAGNSAMIIASQRISTIRNADKIIVLDKGEIVSTGTHDELMRNCAIYKEIASLQLPEKELCRYE